MKIEHPDRIEREVREGAGAGGSDEADVGRARRQVDDGLLPYSSRIVAGHGPKDLFSVVKNLPCKN